MKHEIREGQYLEGGRNRTSMMEGKGPGGRTGKEFLKPVKQSGLKSYRDWWSHNKHTQGLCFACVLLLKVTDFLWPSILTLISQAGKLRGSQNMPFSHERPTCDVQSEPRTAQSMGLRGSHSSPSEVFRELIQYPNQKQEQTNLGLGS